MLKALADRLSGGKVVLYDAAQTNVAELTLGNPAFEPISSKGEMKAHAIAPEEGANADTEVVMGVLMTPEGQPMLRLPVHSQAGQTGIAMNDTKVELGGMVRLDGLTVRW